MLRSRGEERLPVSDALPCSKDGWLEVVVVGNDHGPLADAVIEIATGDGARVTRSKTDEHGCVAFEGLGTEALTMRLALVDASLWQIAAVVDLEKKRSDGMAAKFEAAASDEHDEAGPYDCADGETVDAVAARFGVPKESLTDADHVILDRALPLAKGMIINLPARKIRRDPVTGKRRYLIARIDVPFWLVVRLRDAEHHRRAGRPYLLKLKLTDGSEAPNREGVTDEQGRVVETIPFNVVSGELLVDGDGVVEKRAFRFGAYPPLTDPAGIQLRLESLGFPCGGERGEIGEATRAAVSWFQYAVGLDPTGEIDDATRGALLAVHGF